MKALQLINTSVVQSQLARLLIGKKYSDNDVIDGSGLDDTKGTDAVGALVSALTDGTYDTAIIATAMTANGAANVLNYDTYAKMRAKMKTASQGTLITSGTAAAGGSTVVITLEDKAESASAAANMIIVITGGTGIGEIKAIYSYNTGTRDATVGGANFTVDATSEYEIYDVSDYIKLILATDSDGKTIGRLTWEYLYPTLSSPLVVLYSGAYKYSWHSGTAAGAAAGTLTLAASVAAEDVGYNIATTAQVATNDFFADKYLYIVSGTGAGQLRKIASYVGSTRVATLDENWDTTPTGAVYRLVDGPADAIEQFKKMLSGDPQTIYPDFSTGRIFGDVAVLKAIQYVLDLTDDDADTAVVNKIVNRLIDNAGVLNDAPESGAVRASDMHQDQRYFFSEFLKAGYWIYKASIL